MESDRAIAVSGLSKTYDDICAVDGLDLTVRRGEVYGFLGRNGAGKTTTIRMLLGLVRPTAGSVRLLGTPVVRGEQAVFRHIGCLVETATSYPNLTVRENLEIQRRLTHSPRSTVDEAIDMMGLGASAERRAGHLSLGNRQRLALARAILHRPEVLLLDEPANGLDPAGIVEVRRFLRELANKRGVTVFLSSHILTEVAHIADRIGIIHNGRLLEDLGQDELRAHSRPYLEVRVSDAKQAASLLAERLGLSDIEHHDDGTLHVFDPDAQTKEIARTLVEAGLDLSALFPAAEDLEAHFMRLTGGTE